MTDERKAPFARHCEATAFEIEIRQLKWRLTKCQEELKQANESLTIVYMSGFRDGMATNGGEK
jgi:hypothetical protein